MSLLMDALKKAEQAKQQGSGASAASTELGLEPLPPPEVRPEAPDAGGREGKPFLKLEDLDAEFLAHARGQAAARPDPAPASRPGAPPPRPAEAARREAARNVFTAKQSRPEPGNRPFLLAVAALGLLAAAGIGIYFWLQLRPSAALIRLPSPTSPLAVRDRSPDKPLPLPPVAAREPSPSPTVAASAPIQARLPPREPARPAPAIDQRQLPPIRITTRQPVVSPALIQAYDALQAGDLARAEKIYGRVLADEPHNTDALRGLAAIAAAQGKPREASAYYLRILEANPRDGGAVGGLASLGGRGSDADPLAEESRLRTLLATQPSEPALHFALGNLYARAGRWSDAQQAYFQAYTQAPDNPDYLFNLAVSLDQLHQAALAAQYYQKALAAAAVRPAGFDRQQAETRLRQLQP